MACFLVPVAEATVTTIVTKVLEKKEKQQLIEGVRSEKTVSTEEIPHFSMHLKRLNNLLWGGSGLLAFEHLWHGEIKPFFPFLTAASNTEDIFAMLHEMMTVGVSMAMLVTVIWGIMTVLSIHTEKKNHIDETGMLKEEKL